MLGRNASEGSEPRNANQSQRSNCFIPAKTISRLPQEWRGSLDSVRVEDHGMASHDKPGNLGDPNCRQDSPTLRRAASDCGESGQGRQQAVKSEYSSTTVWKSDRPIVRAVQSIGQLRLKSYLAPDQGIVLSSPICNIFFS